MAEAVFELFALHGLPLSTSGNEPLPLIDPGAVWLVTQGHVDVVAMTITREEASSELQRTHMLRIGRGQLIFGLHPPSAGQNVLLLGFGSAEGQVSRLSVQRLAELALDPEHRAEVMGMIDRWVWAVCALCAHELPPTGAQNLRPGATLELGPGQCAQPQSGVLWLRFEEGSARFMGYEGPCEIGNCKGDMVVPVSKDAWLQADDAGCRITPVVSSRIEPDEAMWAGLDCFNSAIETLIDVQRMRERESDRQRLRRKGEQSRRTVAGAVSELGAVLDRRGSASRGSSTDNSLFAACRMVAEAMGIELADPGAAAQRGDANPLDRIARASRCMLREVRLKGDWWRQDNGPVLAFRDGGETPVALLPESPSSYLLHNPAEGTVERVTARVAATLDPAAFVFYRAFPERKLGGLDLLQFGLRGIGRDIWTVVIMGTIGGLLTLALPLATGLLIDRIIPGADRLQLLQLASALIVAAMAGAAFQVTRNIALTRMQHRAGSGMQAALWHRLMSLPVKFFGSHSSGDLATRAMGIDTIMAEMSTSVITTIVSSLFSLFSLALLFHYSPPAAAVALLMILVFVAVIMLCGIAQFRYQSRLEECNGKMASLLFQLMNGISKIRVAAAEDRAFARWASGFSNLTRLTLRSRIVSNNLTVFASVFPVATYMVIFFLIGKQDATSAGFSTGSFLAFLAAYSSLLHAMIDLGATAVGLLNIVPIYQRLTPILHATPEVTGGKTPVGRLRGSIEVTNASFRYQPDGPLILDKVSFSAEPGEFVAIVGSSGSGKSTLLRLLLGFETPESGSIAFDGFDVAGLDPQGLRRQIGVVLQSGDVFPGDLFTNIVGSAVDLTHTDAWEAAKQAGLDRDIEQMPMGMHTTITEGAGGVSGGQKQRLMIARALVTKPRIVFFDEATSALDNPTQAIVTQSLDRLRATRVVIAHRLSTIVGADKIYVMDKGRVVQVGTYEQLINVPGPFYELVKRQIA